MLLLPSPQDPKEGKKMFFFFFIIIQYRMNQIHYHNQLFSFNKIIYLGIIDLNFPYLGLCKFKTLISIKNLSFFRKLVIYYS